MTSDWSAPAPDLARVWPLEANADTHRLLTGVMTEGIATLDRDGVVLFASPAMGRLLGRPSEDLVGHPLTESLDAEDARRLTAHLPRLLESQGTLDVVFRWDGSSVPVHLSAGPIVTGGFRGLVVAATDLSEERRLAESAETSDRMFRGAIEAMVDSVLLLSPVRDRGGTVSDFRVAYSNLQLREADMSGGVPQVTGKLLRELNPELAGQMLPLLLHVLATRTMFELEAIPVPLGQLRLGLDETRVYALRAGPCGDQVLVVLRDVTEAIESHRRSQELAREKAAVAYRLGAVLDSVGEGVCAVDTEGRCLLVNRAACELLGRTEADLLGVDWHATVHHTLPNGAPYPESACPIHTTLSHGVRHHRLTEMFWKADGTPIDVECTAVPLIEDGAAAGAVVIFADVTARKRADEALREFQARLQQAEELAGLGVWMRVFGEGQEIILSPTTRRILGFGATELVTDEDVLTRLRPDYVASARGLEREIRAEDWRGEFGFRLPNGEERWVVTQVRVMRRDDGQPHLLLGTLMDVTQMKRNQQELKAYAGQQSRLAGIARQGLSAAKPGPLLRSATRVAARVLGGELAALHRFEGDQLVRVAHVGSPPPPRELKVRDSPITGRLLASQGPVLVSDYRQSDLQLSEPLRERGVRSSVIVAIRGRDSPYGVLSVHSTVPRTYSDRDLKWLQAIADVVSVVIERTQVDEQLQATVNELSRLDDQRRVLLSHLVRAQEEERHRVAADLHDDVVQLMAAVNLRLEVLRGRAGPELDDNVDAVQQLIMQSIKRLRELLFELHPPALEHGLVPALRAQLDQLSESTGIAAELTDGAAHEPDPGARTVLFRIAQEALLNVRKHSAASRVRVRVRTVGGGTQVSVSDNGRGLPPGFGSSPPPGHLGLTVMDERARLAGGWWRISRAAGGGTAVDFWVPGLTARLVPGEAVDGGAAPPSAPRGRGR